MARIARVVVPGTPHHITQRGNRRQATFFGDGDYLRYRSLMAEWCAKSGVSIWAYCLMPNHVHLIAVPESEDALRRAIGEAHKCYSRAVNRRLGWQGYLWQGRFSSFPMDDGHALAAARYIELNPVRAGLVEEPGAYPWSSARAHLEGRDDLLVQCQPLLAVVTGTWRAFLETPTPREEWEAFRRHEHTGRPLGGEEFVAHVEAVSGRVLAPQRRGPKSRKRV